MAFRNTKNFIMLILTLMICVFSATLTWAASIENSGLIKLTACTIEGDTVKITATRAKSQKHNRDPIYLFELKAYEDNIYDRDDYLVKIIPNNGQTSFTFTTPLAHKTEGTKLYSSFVTATYKDGEFNPTSERIYLTNPEAVAECNNAYKNPASKKGLLVDFEMIDDAVNLGVKRVLVNFNFAQFKGEGITYEFDGEEYEISKGMVELYDKVISAYTAKGMQVTAVVLNSYDKETPELRFDELKIVTELFNSVSYSQRPKYYNFNTSTTEGFNTTAALASFLAERYSGTNKKYGEVSNWIIGNEINNPNTWNYMGEENFATYMHEYERTFRVFYTAMKAKTANCKLFFSLDYDWVYTPDETDEQKYSGKTVIDTFNRDIKATGNIDWNLAYHPYPLGMNEPNFWDDRESDLITDNEKSPVINFANLDVLTKYMKKKTMLDTNRQTRSIILSEHGFSSVSPTLGSCNAVQAEALARAYAIADANPDIDAFIYNRQVDSPEEMKNLQYFGLWTCDSKGKAKDKKMAWDVYKDVDKK